MAKRRFLLIGMAAVGFLVVLLLAAAAAVWYARPKPAAVTIDVTGTRGLPVTGTCDVDGTPQELTGVVPTRFVLQGSRVTFSLTTTADAGEFQVKAAIADQVYGSLGSGSPPKNGVRGWVKTNWGWSTPTHWIEPFAKDGQPAWLNPPP